MHYIQGLSGLGHCCWCSSAVPLLKVLLRRATTRKSVLIVTVSNVEYSTAEQIQVKAVINLVTKMLNSVLFLGTIVLVYQ